jgi:hypothetical protein
VQLLVFTHILMKRTVQEEVGGERGEGGREGRERERESEREREDRPEC